jgi:hypothetical protein
MSAVPQRLTCGLRSNTTRKKCSVGRRLRKNDAGLVDVWLPNMHAEARQSTPKHAEARRITPKHAEARLSTNALYCSTKVCSTFWGGGEGGRGCLCKSYSMDSLLLTKILFYIKFLVLREFKEKSLYVDCVIETLKLKSESESVIN